MSVHWFPGHMAKAQRLLKENIRVVDVVVELRDARIPLASANPLLEKIIGHKLHLVVLAKADLADQEQTQAWLAYLERGDTKAIALDLRQNRQVFRHLLPLIKKTATPRIPRSKQGGFLLRAPRAMVVGIPNVGKSTLINTLTGRKMAKTGALPGVTRTKQWIKLADGSQLLDTPGILWPKFDDPLVAKLLAVTGAVGTAGFDEVELACWLLGYLQENFPRLLTHYRLAHIALAQEELLQEVARLRGCLLAGGDVDLLRAANLILSDFRLGRLGAATIEHIPTQTVL